MKTFLVISEYYQIALVRETKKFDIKLHMYPKVRDAYNNLYRMNLEDTVGFLYLDDSINDMEGTINLIERLNLYAGSKRRFVIAIKDKDSVQKLSMELKNKLLELKISFMFGFDMVSDEMINKCLYDILQEVEEPYIFSNDEEDSKLEKHGEIITSIYKPLFNKDLEIILTPIDIMSDSSFRECENDTIYNKYRFKFPVIAKLREGFIRAHFGEQTDFSIVINEYRDTKDFIMLWCILFHIDNIIVNFRKGIL